MHSGLGGNRPAVGTRVLRRFFQLNDWEMIAAVHVDDLQAEALTASPSSTGIETSEKNFQGIGAGL